MTSLTSSSKPPALRIVTDRHVFYLTWSAHDDRAEILVHVFRGNSRYEGIFERYTLTSPGTPLSHITWGEWVSLEDQVLDHLTKAIERRSSVYDVAR